MRILFSLDGFQSGTVLRFFAICCLLAVTGVGCVSQKPLPFQYSTSRAASATAPKLDVRPTEDQRPTKDQMDKAVALPKGLDLVIAQEIRTAGLFGNVQEAPAANESDYVLQATLKDLRWEVPDYKKALGKTFAISVATGGIGGLIYGSTDINVLGHARMNFHLKSPDGSTVLNREYFSTTTQKKAKMNCDTPAAYREVAAGALKDILGQFTTDLRQLDLQ